MSTESNRKWARVDSRRRRANELLTSWHNGNREHVLAQLGYHGQDSTGDGRGIVRGRLFAALASLCLDCPSDENLRALSNISEAIYREL